MSVTLGIVIARAGSKGLPDKCVRLLLGRPVIEYTFDHTARSRLLDDVVFSTDSAPAKAIAARRGITIIDRPASLATDEATVDSVARHAVEWWESRNRRTVDAVALLYGNIPVRAKGLIDRAIEHLRRTQADSVRSVALVTKQHPDWVHRLDGDRMTQFRPNGIHRRQDLEPLYYHDGAIAVVTRRALFEATGTPDDRQSFLGRDRRAIVCDPEDAVDIDGPVDLCLAEAVLRFRSNVDRAHAKTATVRIADRAVGNGCQTFVIAEAGVNHNGDVNAALRLVDAADDAGADAVKFQMFRAADLATDAAVTAEYQKKNADAATQREMLKRLELSIEDFRRIKARCDERSIIFLATPFGIDEVACVAELGAPAIKIASTDITNTPLLEAAIATTLPLIVSTGAAYESEIDPAVRFIAAKGAGSRLSLLHCVSRYPAPSESLNLRAIDTLSRRFSLPVGFSDHSTSTITGAIAVAAGACILEKHFTLDKSQPGPDHAMSLNPVELADYISAARQAERSLGDGVIRIDDRQREIRDAARRSIVAATTIARGTRIEPAMLCLKRPGTGLPPSHWPSVVGRVAARDIAPDTLLAGDMLQ